MYKRKVFQVLILLLGFIALYSCEYEKIVPDLPDPGTPVSYANDIQPIWNGVCTGCHGVGQTPPDLTAANSYNSLMNGGFVDTAQPDQSILYTEMAAGGGMSAYTNAADAAKVLNWIKQGAKNN